MPLTLPIIIYYFMTELYNVKGLKKRCLKDKNKSFKGFLMPLTLAIILLFYM